MTHCYLHRRALAALVFLFVLPLGARAQTVTGVFVGNQGNFSDGNGSITFFDPETELSAPVLSDFGTIIQSLLVHDGLVYIASNTGGRIDVLNAASKARTAQIAGVASPRYMAVAAENKLYVTGQVFGGTSPVTVVDLATNTVTGTIEVGGTPEGIAVRGGKAYVALGGFGANGQVAVIDVTTDTADETLELDCFGARTVFVDGEGELQVVCTGKTLYDADYNVVGSEPGALVTVDADHRIVSRIAFTTQVGSAGPGQDVAYAPEAGTAYLVVDGEKALYRIDTAANAVTDTLVLGGDDGIGAVAYDGAAHELYVGRSTGYTTDGYVTVLAADGSERARFDAGILPTYIGLEMDATAAPVQPAEVPVRNLLHAAYPNPFNPATTVPFELATAGEVRVTIVNALGQTVAVLVDGERPAGRHTVRWNAAGRPSGLYLARLEAGGRVATQPLVLVK